MDPSVLQQELLIGYKSQLVGDYHKDSTSLAVTSPVVV